jgi:hypothetical protein
LGKINHPTTSNLSPLAKEQGLELCWNGCHQRIMLRQHQPVGAYNVEIYVATGIRSVIKRFPYSTFLSVCSPICLVGFILLIKPNMTPDWSIAKKPSHLEGHMSIASLLCDPAIT